MLHIYINITTPHKQDKVKGIYVFNMDKQSRYTKTILDLSDPIQISSRHSLMRIEQNKQAFNSIMSNEEELKIRGELEMEIERDLEQEIKDGIYHLALRLHRLYQHQKERNIREISEFGAKNLQERKNKIFSEVNISIKLEGGTKIEFKEIKKEAPAHTRPRTARSDQNFQGILETKKFDWARSLRSSSSAPIPINKRKSLSNNYSASHNININLDNSRRNLTSAAGQRKGNASIQNNNKVLELGWKC